jgi:hypothetical protein
MFRDAKLLLSRGPMFASIGLLIVATFSATVALAEKIPGDPHGSVIPMRGVNLPSAATTNPANIPYNGGLVYAHPPVYAMWWGNPADFPADTHDGMNHFFRMLNGSAYMNLPSQYLFGQQAIIRFDGNLYDYSQPPVNPSSSAEIATEVCNVLQANGMTPNPKALYTVFVSNFPDENFYCAFHDYDACPDGTNIHVIYIPNSNNQPLCWVQPPELSCNAHSNGLQAAANSTAHELMESITDPNFDAWINLSTGNEIGDPCNFQYKRCVYLDDGSKWQLQMIWSDKVEACRQGSGIADD